VKRAHLKFIIVILSLFIFVLPAGAKKAKIEDFGLFTPDGYSGIKITDAFYQNFLGIWYITVKYKSTVYVGSIQILGKSKDGIMWEEKYLLFPETEKTLELKFNHSGEPINIFIEFHSQDYLLARISMALY